MSFALGRVVVGIAVSLLAFAGSASAHGSREVGHAKRWLTDPSGRVLVIHAMNLSSKGFGPTPADIGSTPATPQGVNFGVSDAKLLRRQGFNAVRLTFERYQFAPSPGKYDLAYARQFAETVKLLWRYGIASLIDFHQDDYGPVFNDNGFPEWMTLTDGKPNIKDLPHPFQYLRNPALRAAFDHFWNNDEDAVGYNKLQADDAAILKRAVSGLRNSPGLLGWEILNEPYPGSEDFDCLNVQTGCASWDRHKLSTYYDRMVKAIRTVDREHMIFYEPNVLFTFSVPTHVEPPKDPRLGFAYHDYCIQGAAAAAIFASNPQQSLVNGSCRQIVDRTQDQAIAHSETTGSALLMTEFGTTPGSDTSVADLVQKYDARMLNWMYWNYNTYVGATANNAETIPIGPRQPTVDLQQVLVRPYPQRVAGVPSGWSFDPSTKTFELRYKTWRADGRGWWPAGARSTVFVPRQVYTSGYSSKITGGRVVSRAGAKHLVIESRWGARTVTIRVSPR